MHDNSITGRPYWQLDVAPTEYINPQVEPIDLVWGYEARKA